MGIKLFDSSSPFCWKDNLHLPCTVIILKLCNITFSIFYVSVYLYNFFLLVNFTCHIHCHLLGIVFTVILLCLIYFILFWVFFFLFLLVFVLFLQRSLGQEFPLGLIKFYLHCNIYFILSYCGITREWNVLAGLYVTS